MTTPRTSQAIMGILSVLFAGIQALLVVISWIVPSEAPWVVFIFLWVVAVIFGVTGIVLGAIGVAQANPAARKMSLVGLIANIAILVVFVLSIAVWAAWEYS